MSPTNIRQLINDFLDYLEIEKNRSPLTIRNYHHYLVFLVSYFEKSLGRSPTLSDINNENVRKFRVYLSKQKDQKGKFLKKITQGYYMIALRSFLRWLTKNDYKAMSPEKIDLPKAEPHQVKFLAIEQVNRLLAQPSLSDEIGLRDKAILELLFSTGLRVSELVSLNRDQVNIKTRELGVIGKGKRPRLVFISMRAQKFLERYLVTRQDHYKPIFIRYSGKKPDPSAGGDSLRLTARSIQRMIEKYRRRAGLVVAVTPHVLRHSFATDLLFCGADLRSVQELLGHKNVGTTQIYTHVTNKRLREIHSKYHSGNK
jgi:site-specific recombinase XerD